MTCYLNDHTSKYVGSSHKGKPISRPEANVSIITTSGTGGSEGGDVIKPVVDSGQTLKSKGLKMDNTTFVRKNLLHVSRDFVSKLLFMYSEFTILIECA